jgi:hypothetical protein
MAIGRQGYTRTQAVDLSDKLTQRLGVDPDQRIAVRERLNTWLSENQNSQLPIEGVLAYKMGQGGVIVAVTKGKGLVRYYGQDKDHQLEISGVSGGAQIGGSSEFGVGVILGQNAPETFSGKYNVGNVNATSPDGSTNVAELTKRDAPAGSGKVILVGSATGLSATVAAGQLSLTVKK